MAGGSTDGSWVRRQQCSCCSMNLRHISRCSPHLPSAAARCTQLSAEVSAAQAEAARQIEALKEQLGRELRRQKVG